MKDTIGTIKEAMNALAPANVTTEDRANWAIITAAVNELEEARELLKAIDMVLEVTEPTGKPAQRWSGAALGDSLQATNCDECRVQSWCYEDKVPELEPCLVFRYWLETLNKEPPP